MVTRYRSRGSVEYIVNGISGLAEGGYGPLVNTGKHDAFKSYYTRFNTFSLLPVSFFYNISPVFSPADGEFCLDSAPCSFYYSAIFFVYHSCGLELHSSFDELGSAALAPHLRNIYLLFSMYFSMFVMNSQFVPR